MTRSLHPLLAGALALLMALPALAQPLQFGTPQYFRPYNQNGINVFETVKGTPGAYDGFELFIGAGFTQQFQALDHSNEASAAMVDGVNQNELLDIGAGFNLATANLLIGAQLAEGVRVNLITYLSSRHHPEAWVKDGYVQADALPMLGSETVDRIMEYVTIRVGHMEINYGDAHFRRTDNGMAMYNPFVGNLIMDSFTTEIGGEVYVQHPNGLLAMAAVTGGEIRGAVERPDDRAPSFYGKVGFDRQFSPALRVRLTGSGYTTSSSLNNTLYGGDRAGSRYYGVLENTRSSFAGNFTSGRFNPNFRDAITAFQINPFVQVGGLEVFGVIETASGRLATEEDDRTASQYSVEGIYRFLNNQFYVGGRYNTVSSEMPQFGPAPVADVSLTRIAASAGWFPTENLLLKVEYVNQSYDDFAESSIFHDGEFSGLMIEGVLAF
jgi:hypothetical protein